MIAKLWMLGCFSMLAMTGLSSGQEAGAPSMGPLKRTSPGEVSPEFLSKALGPVKGGLPWPLQERLERADGEDRWLVELGSRWDRKRICLMKLDRATGESELEQVIEAGGNWCYLPKRNWLFAGRIIPQKKKEAKPGEYVPYETPRLIYECFDLATNQALWRMPGEELVLWSSVSHDGNELIVLRGGAPPKGTNEGDAFVAWHDLKTGQLNRKVELPGLTELQENRYSRSAIADTPDVTYVCRQSDHDYQCLQIAHGSDKVAPLFEDKDEFGAAMAPLEPGANWFVHCSDDFKWVAFYTSQMLHVFKRDMETLTELKSISAGDDRAVGDDVSNVRFIPKSSRLIVGSMRKTIVLDLAAKKIEEKTFDHGGPLSDVTEDGNQIVLWDNGGSWPIDIKDGKSIRDSSSRSKVQHCCPLQDLAFSPSGKHLISNDYSRFIVWNVATGKALAGLATSKEIESSYNFHGLTSPQFAEKQGKIYGADGLRALEWSLADIEKSSGTRVLEGKPAFGSIGRTDPIYNMELSIDESGERIIDADADEVRFRLNSNPGASRKLSVIGGSGLFYFPANQDKLLIVGYDHCSEIDLKGGPPVPLKKSAFVLTPSGMAYAYRVTGDEDSKIFRYPIEKDSPEDEVTLVRAPWHFESGKSDATNDNRFFVYELSDDDQDSIGVMNWEKKSLVRIFKSPTKIAFLKVSPDGKTVAVAGHDSRVYLWDLSGL